MNDEELMAGMAGVVKDYVARATAPLLERIARLETDLAAKPTTDALADIMARNAMAVAAALPKPVDGKDGAAGADGASVTLADVLPSLERAAAEAAVAAVTRDHGKALKAEDVRGWIDAAVAALPPAVDGKDGIDGAPGRDGVDGSNGADGIDGKDGADGLNGKDGADGVAGRDGTDGLNGKDGADGINGKDGTDGIHGKDGTSIKPEFVSQMIKSEVERAVAMIPPPEDGKPGEPGRNGTDGVDGYTLDDIDLKMDGRTLTFTLQSGNREVVKHVELPMVKYMGVFVAGAQHKQGDCVTHSGSMWIALKDTAGPPCGGSDEWQLAVKRGKDGSA